MGAITVEDVNNCWRKTSDEHGENWQESLPEHYRDILTIVKDCGGVCLDTRLLERLQAKENYTRGELWYSLKVLAEMQIVRLRERRRDCMLVLEATLLKI